MSAPVLTQDDMDVIRARHYGWEKAKPGLLAKVFGVSVQKINAVLKSGSTW
jgi:hypothetical protein